MPRSRLALPANRITRAVPALLAAGLLTLLAAAPAGAFPGPWVAPAIDLSADGQSALAPQLAVGADGGATAIWTRSNGTNDIVQASTRPPGGSFSAAIDLSATGQSASTPQLATAADGTTTAVWTRSNGTHSIVQASTRPPGGAFSAPVDLSATGQNAYDPQPAVAADGTITVVWYRSNGTHLIVQASTRPPGGAFGAPVDLSATGQTAEHPQLAVGADGTTTVTWYRSDGTNDIVQASTRAPGGAFSAPVDLSASGRDANNPQPATAPDGTTTVVWARSNGTYTIVQASTRPPGGTFGAPVDLSADGASATSPQLTVARDGTTTAVWSRSNGTYTIVQAATRPTGGTFGAPVDLSADGANAGGQQIASAADGTTTAVWFRYSGVPRIVQSSTRAPGGSFGVPVDLSAPGQDAYGPQLAIAPDGATAAAWARSNGTYVVVQAAFTANPPALRSAPKIVGTPAAGSTLSCDGGLWTGAASIATNWLRDGAVVAAGPAYVIGANDQGRALLCRARATNAFGAAEAQSLPVVVAAPAAPAPDRTAPTLTVLTKTRLTRASFLRNGVTVRVSADESSTVLAELLARAKGARISAVSFNLALGSRTARRVQNSVAIKIRPNRTLVGKTRRFAIRLRLTAEDAAGNRRVTGKTIRVAG